MVQTNALVVAVVVIVVLYKWIVVEVVGRHATRNLPLLLIENLTLISFAYLVIGVVATIWLARHISCFIHEVHSRPVSGAGFFLLFMGKTRTNLMLLRNFHEAR